MFWYVWYVLIQQNQTWKHLFWVPGPSSLGRFQAIRRELVGDGIALEEAGLDRQDYPPWN